MRPNGPNDPNRLSCKERRLCERLPMFFLSDTCDWNRVRSDLRADSSPGGMPVILLPPMPCPPGGGGGEVFLADSVVLNDSCPEHRRISKWPIPFGKPIAPPILQFSRAPTHAAITLGCRGKGGPEVLIREVGADGSPLPRGSLFPQGPGGSAAAAVTSTENYINKAVNFNWAQASFWAPGVGGGRGRGWVGGGCVGSAAPPRILF